MAKANLVVAHAQVGFDGVTLQLLERSLEDGTLCPWSFNRAIDLMFADLPAEEARALVLSLLDTDDVRVRHKMIDQAIHHEKVQEGQLHSDQFEIPSYLLHPSIRH